MSAEAGEMLVWVGLWLAWLVVCGVISMACEGLWESVQELRQRPMATRVRRQE